MTPRDEGRLTMSRYDKPLTPRQVAATKDEDIDFSDIPELDERFWQQAELVETTHTLHQRLQDLQRERSALNEMVLRK